MRVRNIVNVMIFFRLRMGDDIVSTLTAKMSNDVVAQYNMMSNLTAEIEDIVAQQNMVPNLTVEMSDDVVASHDMKRCVICREE